MVFISIITLAQLVLSCAVCFYTAGFHLAFITGSESVIKRWDRLCFPMSFPWPNKLHTGTIKLSYVLSASMRACNMRVCVCVGGGGGGG